MSISMYSASVPVFTRLLGNALVWLDKAEAHAKARKFDPNNYLGLRLAPDMLPLSRQVQIASDSAKSALARSRIVSSLEGRPVTTSRADVDLVVTEYGVADLRGRSLTERAARLRAVAHPDFRDRLGG